MTKYFTEFKHNSKKEGFPRGSIPRLALPHKRIEKNKRMVLFMAYENRIKFYEEQIEALLYNIEEKEKSYIYEQVRIIKRKIEELKSR